MTSPKKLPFAPVLRSLLEEEGRLLDHPTSERLSDYHAGRLTPEETDLLERHLRGCQECSGLLRDLAEFEEFTPAPAAETLADRGAQAAWRRLRERLPESVPEAVAGPRSGPVPISQPAPVVRMDEVKREPKRSAPRDAWPRSATLIAAALSCCVIGMGVWVARLQSKAHDLSKPSANVAMIELYPDAVRSVVQKMVSSVGDHIFLALDPPNKESIVAFNAEIRKADSGQLMARVDGLHKMESGELHLLVPRSLLPPGAYQVDLFGEGNGSTPLATYAFTVSSP
jgi:Putative zinc-finger